MNAPATRASPTNETGNESTNLHRRSLIKGLLVIPAALSAGGLPAARRTAATAAPEPSVFRGYVAGFRFHDGPGMIGRMREGDPVSLVREPDNPHDRHAVRIDYAGRSIGYVPRTVSEHVVWALGDRAAAPGVISRLAPGAVPWRAVRIRAG